MNRIFFFLHCKDTATFLTIQTFVQKYLNICAILHDFQRFYVAQHKNPALSHDIPSALRQKHPKTDSRHISKINNEAENIRSSYNDATESLLAKHQLQQMLELHRTKSQTTK